MANRDERRTNELRIGELAELSGTTTRAIRHYHDIGLLPEPPRDPSGYRRYGSQDLVQLVRIRRMRSLGVALDDIGSALSGEPAHAGDLTDVLRSLAEDISRQIESLQLLRARVLDLSTNGTLGQPVEAWASELRSRGLLGDSVELPESERTAIELVDALQPGGIGAVAATIDGVLADPAMLARISKLLQRFKALGDESDQGTIESLATDFVTVVPRPAALPHGVDEELMDKLTSGRFSPPQQACLRRIRALLDERAR